MTELRDLTGPYGEAYELPVLDRPEYAATVQHWLLNAPRFHPAWSQYSVAIIRLSEIEGMAPPKLAFPGATHEVSVAVLDPRDGRQTRETLAEYADPASPKYRKLPYLVPINIAAQVEADDEIMARLGPFIIRMVIERGVTPETSDAPERVRAYWDEMVANGVAHMRGEHDHHD